MKLLVTGWLVLLVFAMTGCSKKMEPKEISLGVATSLREVMPELIRAYEGGHPGRRVVATYGASGDLKKAVEAGAPLDAVIFAGAKPLDELAREGLVDATSRRVVASNSLILVGAKDGPTLTFASLRSLAPEQKLAVGDPRTVPAGEYARDYLVALGEWDALQSRLVLGANVAAVLVYARRGEAVAAIVYGTELHGSLGLVALDEARGPSAPHPQVVAGIVRDGRERAGAVDFLEFATSTDGEKVLASFAFGPP